MTLTRLLTTAAAAALIACPAIAFAAGDSPAAPAAPPADTMAPAAPPAPVLPRIPTVVGGADIYATLKASGQFTILVKALDQAGLSAVLQKYPNLTFFAPTDDAFKALPADQLAKMLAPGDAAANQLQQVLTYHLITTQVDSSRIKGAKGPAPTQEKSTILLDGSNPDDLMANNADIIQADVRTTNGGIIHVIDKVLIPADSPYAAAAPAPAPAAPTAPASPTSATAPASTGG